MEEQEKSKTFNYFKEFIKSFDNQKLNENNKKIIQKNGVVYTPDYLARYIVQRSLNFHIREIILVDDYQEKELIQEEFNLESLRKFPSLRKRIFDKLEKIKILDPSCGSGIFLIEAAEYLFQLHKFNSPDISDLQIKKKILQNSIFGVEIEKKACMISKLRLISWMLNSNDINIKIVIKELDIEHINQVEKQLKCRFNVYNSDYLLEFAPNQKFDLIIGNPPFIENKKIVNKNYKKKISKNFKSAYRLYDLSILFIEKAFKLVHNNGFVSYLLTNKFLAADYGKKIREIIISESFIQEIINISSLPVFVKASAYPIIIFMKKTDNKVNNMIKVKNIDNINQLHNPEYENYQEMPLSVIKKLPKHVIPISGNIDLIKYLYDNFDSMTDTIEDLKIIYRPFGFLDWYKNFEHVSKKLDSDDDLLLIGTGNVGKYHVLFNKRIKIAKKDLEIQYFRYSKDNQDIWQELSQEKLIFREIAKKLTFVYDPGIFTNLTGLYFLRSPSHNTDDLFALLTILNSELINQVFNTLFGTLHMSGGYLRYNGTFIKRLPLPKHYPRSLSRLGKILQFISQLNYDLSYFSHLSIIEKGELDILLKFYKNLSNSLVEQLYFKKLPVLQENNLSLLLKPGEDIPNIQFKYCIPRFALKKYETFNRKELNSQILKIQVFFKEYHDIIKSEMESLNKIFKI